MRHSDIRSWICELVSSRVGLAAGGIDIATPLDEYGVDSLEAANLSGEMEARLGMRLDPTLLWDHRTVWELSVVLAELVGTDIEMPEDPADLDAVLALLENK